MDDFVHVPKASGSTLRTILSRQYGVDHILYFEPASSAWQKRHDETPAEFLKHKIEEGAIKLITGHHPFGQHELIARPMRCFSLLREPISRAVSEYYYAFSYPHHGFREDILAGRLTLNDFLTEPKYGMRSVQIRMIAGSWGERGDPERAAIDNATRCFSAIGLTERFEESVLYIAKVLGWKPPIFVKRNVTQLDQREAVARLQNEAEAKHRYVQEFAPEYRLYNFVDKLLTQRISAEGEAFQKALDAYRGIQDEIERLASDEVFKTYEFHRDDELPPYASRLLESDAYRLIEDYLAEPIRDIPQPCNYHGFVDACRDNLISGWALDLWRDTPIEVTILRKGQAILKSKCDLIRPDVAERINSRPEVGFRIQLNEMIADPKEYRICFENTSLALRRSQ